MKDIKRVGIVFPGQGSQYIGMGKKLYDRYACVQKKFQEASDILGYDLKNLCFYGDNIILQNSEYTQTAIFTVSYVAYLALIEEYDLEPVCLAGHSMGEITALVCANAIDFNQGLQIIRKRGQIMQEFAANIGGMYAIVNIKKEELEHVCQRVSDEKDFVTISNYNSSQQYTISGSYCALKKVLPIIKDKGGVAIPLKVSGPFHSMYMKKSAEEFGAFLSEYTLMSPHYPIVSNITGKDYDTNSNIKDILVKQIYSPILWEKCVRSMLDKDINMMIELGPKNVLTKIIRQQTNETKIYASDQENELNEFYKMLGDSYGNYKNDASRREGLVRNCLRCAVCIRNDCEDEKEYEQKFRIPYTKIKMKYFMFKEKCELIPLDLANDAVDMLKTACRIKKVLKEEEEKIFLDIIMNTGTKSLVLK